MPEAALSLGSNLGDKAGAIEDALQSLGESDDIRLLRRSRLYRTEPWGDADQDWFLNACALIETGLSPQALLECCLAIETSLGRDRTKSRRWGPRPIDIDLLFYGDVVLSEPRLTLPHPHMLERAFVLVPLNEVAPDAHIRDQRIKDALRGLDTSGVRLWEGGA